MSFIKSRLRRVEEAVRGGACTECKLPLDVPRHIVYYEDEGRPAHADERCPACCRHLWTVIKVVEASEAEGEGDTGYEPV
jgi:hypothetical protein